MSLSAPRLKSPTFKENIDSTLQTFKALGENPKVKKVAIQVFKGLACVACGAGLGLLACTPLGVSVGIGIGAGAAAGAFVYIAVASVHAAIQAYGFPSNSYLTAPPVSIDRLAPETKHKKFNKIYQHMAEQKVVQDWLKNKNFTLQEGAEHLWKEFQGGLCHGEAQALVSLMQEHYALEGEDLLKKIKSKMVFERQILELIRADIPNHHDIQDLVFNIPNATSAFHESFKRSELENYASLILNNLKDKKNTLKDDYHMLTATIRLQNTESAHTIFVGLHPTYRLYDSYNHIYTGLYEGFESEEAFLNGLQQHIQGYLSPIRPTALKFDDIIIRGYAVDCLKERDESQSVQAGSTFI